MSTDNQFNEKTGQAVSDAKAARTSQQGSQPGLPANLATAQGGEVLSPPTKEGLGLGFVGEHGTLATSYNIERTIQGVQALEAISPELQSARLGGGSSYINSNGVGNIGALNNIQYTWNILNEQHSISGISYTGSGSLATVLNNTNNAVVSSVATNSQTATTLVSVTGLDYSTYSGAVAFALNPTVQSINSVSGTVYTWRDQYYSINIDMDDSGTTAALLANSNVLSITSVSGPAIPIVGEEHEITGTNYSGSGATNYATLVHPLANPTGVLASITLVSGTGAGVIYPAAGVWAAGWLQSSPGQISFTNNSEFDTLDAAASGNKIPFSGDSFYVSYGFDINYPATGTQVSGAGYFQSGDYIVFTNGRYTNYGNAVLQEAIPDSGQNFELRYTYSGNLIPVGLLNTAGWQLSGNSLVITNEGFDTFEIASVTSPTGTIPKSGESISINYTYADVVNPSSVGTSGAGWYQLGTTLMMTNGTYSTYQTAANAGYIPASGENFFVDYTYTSGGGGQSTPASENYTMLDNQRANTVYIPNVGNRFSR